MNSESKMVMEGEGQRKNLLLFFFEYFMKIRGKNDVQTISE